MTIEFNPSISDEMRGTIMKALKNIEYKGDLRILFAIESGSRAWGFPSPDSDYDVRFVYARPVDWYLTLAPGRDVYELPIDEVLDINGWDIKKALGLLLKPNPVIAVRRPNEAVAAMEWNWLIENGVYVNLAVPPGTPQSSSLLRISLSAAHTEEDINTILKAFADLKDNQGALMAGMASKLQAAE